jgi:hypothetical protein
MRRAQPTCGPVLLINSNPCARLRLPSQVHTLGARRSGWVPGHIDGWAPMKTYSEGATFSGRIGRTWQESEPAFPVKPSAPEGAPNVVYIVLDDVGFGWFSHFRSRREERQPGPTSPGEGAASTATCGAWVNPILVSPAAGSPAAQTPQRWSYGRRCSGHPATPVSVRQRRALLLPSPVHR